MVEVRRMFEMTDFDPEIQKEIQKKFGDAGSKQGGNGFVQAALAFGSFFGVRRLDAALPFQRRAQSSVSWQSRRLHRGGAP